MPIDEKSLEALGQAPADYVKRIDEAVRYLDMAGDADGPRKWSLQQIGEEQHSSSRRPKMSNEESESGEALSPASMARLEALADRLNCLTEYDMLLLAGVTETTLQMWRKRGDGPAYARCGTRYFYPLAAVSAWLESKMRERKPTVGDQL